MYAVLDGSLEIRARGDRRVLSGSFPYNRTATVRSSGRTRKERFASGSLSWQVREFQKLMEEYAAVGQKALDKVRKEALEDALERRNTHLLVGHSYDRAIADMRTGTLTVKHTAAAVELEAELPDPDRMPSWVRDAVLAVEGGPLSANVRETRSTQRIRVGRRQRKRTCWDCEREWKRMVVPPWNRGGQAKRGSSCGPRGSR